MDTQIFEAMRGDKIVASIRGAEQVASLLTAKPKVIFIVKANIMDLPLAVKLLKGHNKYVFVHVDMIEGLGHDGIALEYLTTLMDLDGIITTKGPLIQKANKLGLNTVQRVFMIDSVSINTAVSNVFKYKPDALEVMPGLVPKAIDIIRKSVDIPLITGGMITEEAEVRYMLESDVTCISTTREKLWALVGSL